MTAARWPEAWWSSFNGETELRLYVGHVLDVLRTLPAGSVNLVMTSPPYYGLRDYGLPPVVWGGDPACAHDWRGASCARCGAWKGQLGLEPSVEMYVAHLLAVFDEVRRVLRDDGCCFVNLGDTYSGSWGNYGAREGNQRPRRSERWVRLGYEAPGAAWNGLPPQAGAGDAPRKSLLGIPWRFALAMVDRGWILRNAVVWHKPNAMPSSVKDRFACTYEFVFFFAKRERYWFDLDAVRVPHKTGPARFNYRVREAAEGRLEAKFGAMYRAREHEVARYEHARRAKTAVEDTFRTGAAMRLPPEPGEDGAFHPLGKNPGDVWEIPSEPFPDAHFAVYPTALCERAIAAACPPRVCAACGRAPTRCVVVSYARPQVPGYALPQAVHAGGGTIHSRFARALALRRTAEWDECGCRAGSCPGVVLDPFAGSGTTLLAAQRLGRSAVGIELKPEYAEMARRRLEGEHRQLRLPVLFA